MNPLIIVKKRIYWSAKFIKYFDNPMTASILALKLSIIEHFNVNQK